MDDGINPDAPIRNRKSTKKRKRESVKKVNENEPTPKGLTPSPLG